MPESQETPDGESGAEVRQGESGPGASAEDAGQIDVTEGSKLESGEAQPRAATGSGRRTSVFLVYAPIFATGLSGIVAEYALSTLASYLLGNSILQFCLVISITMFAMGVGSEVSKRIQGDLVARFVGAELALSVVGGTSVVLIYTAAAHTTLTPVLIYTTCFFIGLLIGLEIPLITRINERFEPLGENIGNVMKWDYFGALVGGVLFALVLLPRVGLTYTPPLMGLLNAAVALAFFVRLRREVRRPKIVAAGFVVVAVIFVGLFAFSNRIVLYAEQSQYNDTIVYQNRTLYQQLTITRSTTGNYYFYINGHTQFASQDEHRYHEPLVHPLMVLLKNRESILILGGGDGMAAREVLKYPEVKKVTLVDLDPAMVRLCRTHPVLSRLNGKAFDDPRMKFVYEDALQFITRSKEHFDGIIIDLPDPSNVSLAKLYTRQFYRLARKRLSVHGGLATQSTSPYHSRQAFVCVHKTLESAGYSVVAYHTDVPSFGQWGWQLGFRRGIRTTTEMRQVLETSRVPVKTRFVNQDAIKAMMLWGKGVWEILPDVKVNTEVHPVLSQYYYRGWRDDP